MTVESNSDSRGTADERSLMTAEVEIFRGETISESKYRTHPVDYILDEFWPWIRSPVLGGGERIIPTFEGVTYASQVQRDPVPIVRVALADNDAAHPLIEGALLNTCHPMEKPWSLDDSSESRTERENSRRNWSHKRD